MIRHLQHRQGINPIARRYKGDRAIADLVRISAGELLQVRFIVDYRIRAVMLRVAPAYRFTSEHSKWIGWLKSLGAALQRPTFGFSIAIGRGRDGRNVRRVALAFGRGSRPPVPAC